MKDAISLLSIFSRLRRVTSGQQYIAEIDGLRFVAIAVVVLYHVSMMITISGHNLDGSGHGLNGGGEALFRFIRHGDRGVELFFVISGMVLGLPFARHRLQHGKPVQLKAYLIRRVTRLEPPYLANLVLRAPLAAYAHHLTLAQTLAHLGVSVLYADWLVYGRPPALHPPSWSLAIEVQFYLLAPLLAIALFHESTRLRRAVSILFIAISSVAAAHFQPGPILEGFAKLSLLSFAQYFIFGMLMADLYLTVLPRLKSHLAWDVVSVPLWIALFTMPDEFAAYLLPPVLLLLFVATFRSIYLRRFLSADAIAITGGMCYSIYLTHSLVLQGCTALAQRIFPQMSFWLYYAALCVFTVPCVLVVGTLFFMLIERPCMDRNWPRKAWSKLRGHPSEA